MNKSFLFAMNRKTNRAQAMIGFSCYEQLQGAFPCGIMLSDGTSADGIGRVRDAHSFLTRAAKGKTRIVFDNTFPAMLSAGIELRASEDPDDTLPGMQVAVGFTPSKADCGCLWHYQTGDNSYTGGAYGHAHWAVIDLYRRSNSAELAKDIADQIAESVSQLVN